MPRALCVAEKPSMAKSLANLLVDGPPTAIHKRRGCNKYCLNFDLPARRVRGQSYQLTVTSVLGHVMCCEFPRDYRQWQYPPPVQLFHTELEWMVHPDMKDVARNLEQEARKCDVLIIWTDCDREGENIGWEIEQICRRAAPRIQVFRARFSVVQRREVLQALENLQPLDYNSAEAVRARIELDLRIGAAFTRFQTLTFSPLFPVELDGKVISYGGCQFPTLGFVVEQYWQRERFVPERFWRISVTDQRPLGGGGAAAGQQGSQSRPGQAGVNENTVTTVNFSWDRTSLFDEQVCAVLHEECRQAGMATVLDVRSKPTSRLRPLPLTTVELQKSATSLLRITSHRVMEIAEKLYNQGLISYPRTETDVFDRQMDLKELVSRQTADPVWGYYARKLVDEGGFRWPRAGRKNDMAHPPIHPTRHSDALQGDEKRVYDFITRLFLACCSEDAKGFQSNVSIELAGERFHASGTRVVERNFLEIYTYSGWSTHLLPEYRVGERFRPQAINMAEGRTSPPSLLTEAGLIATMDANGIGTDATIAEHIKRIQDRQYVFKEGNIFVPSTLGLALVEGYDNIAFDKSLAKPDLRRDLEQKLAAVCAGRETRENVVRAGIRDYLEMFERACAESFRIQRAMAKYFGRAPDRQGPPPRNNDNGGGGGHFGGPPPPPPPAARRPPGGGGFGNNDNSRRSPPPSHPGNDDGDNFDDNFFNRGGGTRPPRADSFASTSQGGNRTTGIAQPSGASISDADAPCCDCGAPSVSRTVTKESANKGKQFYACAERSCNFFQWADQQMSRPAPSFNNYATGSNRSYNSTDSKNGSDSFFTNNFQPPTFNTSTESQKPKCQCDLHASLRTVSKDGPNKGRKFWSCPNVSKKCQFFQWDDETDGSVAGGSRENQGARNPSAMAGATCFQCGETGHWASVCPNGRGTSFSNSSDRRSNSSTRARGKRGGGTKRRGRGRGRGGKNSFDD